MEKHFRIEDKTIYLKKDCKQCVILKACKFHAKMSELCKSNEFYSMTEYLEWNNTLEVFELHASCRYYKLNYSIPEDGSVSLEIDQSIISEIVGIEARKKYDLNQYSISIKKNKAAIIFGKNSERVELKITDLIKGYKFK